MVQEVVDGGLRIGADLAGSIQKGAVIRKVGTISVDPANQGGAGFFNTDVTISGVKAGDLIFMFPPATLEDTLRHVGSSVQAADTVRIRLEATAAVNGAARTWSYIHISLS